MGAGTDGVYQKDSRQIWVQAELKSKADCKADKQNSNRKRHRGTERVQTYIASNKQLNAN